MAEKNLFGGGNPQGMYVPMSEDEQEVLMRLVESQTLEIFIHDWNLLVIPSRVGYGDKRIQVQFAFSMPGIPGMTVGRVSSLDVELRTSTGISLFRKPYPIVGYDGKPPLLGPEIVVELIWDIAIDHMDPELVKTIKPGALGLTTRRLDKDTGDRTMTGNMQLSGEQKRILRVVEAGEKAVREMDPVDPYNK